MSDYASLFLTKKSTFVTLSIFLLWLITATGHAQSEPFTTDSIPLVEEEVAFTYHFKGNLSKEEIHTRMLYYLDRELDPYYGAFLKNNSDSVVCQIIDYLEIESNLLHVFGMYMTYDMKFVFKEGLSELTISNIIFMEKSNFEKQESTSHEFYFREFTGKEIMIDKSYKQLFKRDTSDRITIAVLKRLNGIVSDLSSYFVD
jgi:NADPH-dependent 7-cyano-7-deazaguanine reductase QueF-like protein